MRKTIDSAGKFTHRLKKNIHEYSEHVRVGVIARLLGKDKGDIIHWYETVKEVKISKKGKQRIIKGYSIKPDDLNIECYKEFLLSKLGDTLNLAGFSLSELGYSILQISSQISRQYAI